MTTDFLESGITEEELRTERAQRAVRAFRAMMPGLNGYIHAITGRKDLRIQIDPGAPRTDGEKIFFCPPIELGDMTPHSRGLCDRRDPKTRRQMCPACLTREEVLIKILHEIAHNLYGTFATPSVQVVEKALSRAIDEIGTKYAEEIKKRWEVVPDYKKRDVLNLSGLISPFLPVLVNAIEDIRVDEAMFKSRKGTKVMFDAMAEAAFVEGVTDGDGHTWSWSERPLNSQIIIGVFALGSGYNYEGWFHEKVEKALADEYLRELIARIGTLRSSEGSYNLSFPILARLRELGFCRNEEDPEDDYEEEQEPDEEPEEQDEESDEGDGSEEGPSDSESGDEGSPDQQPDEGDDQESEASDSGSPSAGDEDSPGDGDEDESGSGDPDSSGDEDAESGDSGAGSGTGLPEHSDADQEEADGGETEEPEDGSEYDASDESDGSGSEGDREGDSGSDQGVGEESEGDSSGEADSSAGGQGGVPEEGSGELGDEQSADPDAGPGSDGDSEPDEAELGGEVDEGHDSGGDNGVREDAPEVSASGERDGEPGRDREPLDEEAKGDDGDDSSDPSDTAFGDGDLSGGDADLEDLDSGDDESEELIDTGADEGKGGTEVDEPAYGSADEALQDVHVFGKHEVERAEPTAEDLADEKAIEKAIIQGEYFEKPSQNVGGVREHKFGVPTVLAGRDIATGWQDVMGSSSFGTRMAKRLGIDVDIDVGEETLGPALIQMRRAFADNARGAQLPHLKRGKVNNRVLGKRAWSGDDRLFKKNVIPGKRSYAVLIGIDISGSTVGVNIALAKRAANAQAELCSRMGIDFAVYAHTANSWDEAGARDLWLDVYEIKSFDAPWNDKAKEALNKISSDSENLDGHGVEYYRKIIERHQATDKIILYYSDGKMPAANYVEELEILQREIAYCKAHGITLMGVGIRTDSPARHGLDTVQVDDDSSIPKVIKHLQTALLRRR